MGIFNKKQAQDGKKRLIVKLKDYCGMWIEDAQHIATKFITDYTEKFKSNHLDTRNLTDVQIRQAITDGDMRN